MTGGTVLGLALMLGGLGESAWALRTKAPSHFAVQGLVLLQLGLLAVVNTLVERPAAKLAAMSVMGLSAVISVGLHVHLVRKWRQAQTGVGTTG